MADVTGSNDETVRQIVEALQSVRQSSADLSEDERRERFRRTLEDETGALPDAEAELLLQAVRGRLIDESLDREQRLVALETQVQQLRSERDGLGAERDRLKKENAKLRAARRATTLGSGADLLEELHTALRQFTDGKEIEKGSLDSSDAEARLFRMILALLGFALHLEDAVNVLLMEFEVGPVENMNTRQAQTYMERVRDRLRACLDNEEGSIQALREILDRNMRFLIDLNTAYTSCVYDGSKAMLSSMDPQPILEEHKRIMGHDFEKSFHALSRIQGDLLNLTRAELWRQFFYEPFRERLAAGLETEASDS